MIKENRVSKYLLYSIGEIVLVVIGILIALQINNWNGQRKVDIEMVKVLNEVRSNLISDSLQIRKTCAMKLEDIRVQSMVIHALEIGNIPYDSLDHHLGRVMLARRIVLVDNGYQLMKKFTPSEYHLPWKTVDRQYSLFKVMHTAKSRRRTTQWTNSVLPKIPLSSSVGFMESSGLLT